MSKTSNLDAHLLVLKNKIKTEEEKLRSIINARLNEESRITYLKDTRNKEAAELARIKEFNQVELNKLESTNKVVDRKELDIKEREELLVKERELFTEEIKSQLKKLEETKVNLYIDIKELEDRYELRVKDYNIQEKELTAKIESLKIQSLNKTTELQELEANIKDTQDTLSESTQSLTRALKDKEIVLAKLEKAIMETASYGVCRRRRKNFIQNNTTT